MNFDIHVAIPISIIVISIAIFIWFFWKYFLPAKCIKKNILNSIDGLKNVDSYRQFNEEIFHEDALKSSFRAYKKSLHEIKEETEYGVSEVVAVKASAPAEMYFTHTNIVDTPLQTEFFKHLPGIVTGIGIVGTFAGLVIGLMGFDTSGSPQQVQESVNNLMDGVFWAFIASGSAICISLVITSIEKFQIKSLYTHLENMHAKIDVLFEQELVENYLNEIVQISDKNLTQSRHLKDAFVDDLKKLLIQVSHDSRNSQNELFGRLQSSYQETSNNIAHVMSHSIKEALQEPLSKIADSVSHTTQNQGEAVNTLLTDVLTQFMHQLENYFGKQMMDVSGVLQQTSMSLNEMQSGITNLIGELRHAGLEHSSEVNSQMSKMMESMQISQKMAQDKLVEVLNEISTTGGETNQALQQQVQDTLESIVTQMSNQMVNMASVLETNREFSQRENEESTRQFHEQTQHAMTEVVKKLSSMTNEVGLQLQQGQQETIRATQDMVQGATKSFEHTMNVMEQERVKADEDRKSLTEDAHNAAKQLNADLMNSVNMMLDEFSSQIKNTIAELRDKQNQTNYDNQKLIEQINQSTMNLINSINQSINAAQDNVNKLSTVTTNAIRDLNIGAEKVGLAVSDMGDSAKVTSEVLNRGASLIAQSSEVSNALTDASKQLSKMLNDYEKANNTVQTAVNAFANVFNNSQSQVQSSGQILKGMQDLSNHFSELQTQTQQYLDGISDVIAKAFKEFKTYTNDSLQNTLAEFDTELSRGVKHLAGSIEDLASTAEDIAELQQKRHANTY